MRPLKHLTPRYIWDRMIEKTYRAMHPGLPWLSPVANDILSSCMTRDDCGLEFGSGRSTIWFARRVGRLTSVEHNPEWYKKVSEMLAAAAIKNVNYLLKSQVSDSENLLPDYVRVADEFEANSLTYVLIDGVCRDLCTEMVLDKIVPGGMLIIDNVHLYFPNNSRCPNSVPPTAKPISLVWERVYDEVRHWRCIWTGNGVSDTAIYLKPCD